jgi:MFS family permease
VIDKTQSVADGIRVSTSATQTSHRSLVHHHDFRRLWAGDAVSALGVQLVGLAMPVMAVRVLGADEFQMGLLGTFEMLAFLVVGLPAGAWVDRWRKRRVIIAGDLVRGAVLLSLPLAWLLDALTMWQVYVVALVVGTATVFFDVAHQSYLPDLVPSRQIGEANAKIMATGSVTQIAGPAVGAALIRLVGAPLTIGATAVAMAASTLFVGRIRHVEETPSKDGRRPLRTEIWEGLSFVLRQPLLRRIVLCTSLSNLSGAVSSVLLVLFVLRDLGLTEAALGLVFSVGSVGGLLSALTVTRIARVLGEGRTIPAMALLVVPFAALTPLAAQVPPVPALAIGSFGVSFGAVGYNVIQVSFRQRLCPKPLLGRMNASIRFVVWGTMPIGAFAGGLLGEALGVVPTLWLTVAGFFVAALPVLLSPLARMGDLPRELDAHAD